MDERIIKISQGRGISYHKATGHKLAFIKVNDDGTIKVRDQDDKIKDYYPQELTTQEEQDAENDALNATLNRNTMVGVNTNIK